MNEEEKNKAFKDSLWLENYKSFIENERASSLECDKHIFYFLSAVITGLSYVVYNCYEKHCLLALIFAFPILPATYSIYSTLKIYRYNFRALAIVKKIYDNIFLYDKTDNKQNETELSELKKRIALARKMAIKCFRICICLTITIFGLFLCGNAIKSIDDKMTKETKDYEGVFGFSLNTPLPEVKTAGSYVQAPMPPRVIVETKQQPTQVTNANTKKQDVKKP